MHICKTLLFEAVCFGALAASLMATPEKRALGFKSDGFGLCYGPYREGQRPDGKAPSRAQLREDVRILTKCGDAIRVYGAGHFAADLLEVLEEEKSSLKVMLGCWLGQEAVYGVDGEKKEDKPGVREANKRETDTLVELANRYPKRIAALCVGNETQVYWSGHRMHPETLTKWIQYVREKAKQPVGTADDYNFWNKPESKVIAKELDFLVTHLYALWNGRKIEEALEWTTRQYKEASAS